MKKVLIFVVGLVIGFAGGSSAGDRIMHWIDVQTIGMAGWVARSSGADEDGRYTLLTNAEANRVFMKRLYVSGAERTEIAEVGCGGTGSITFERSGRTMPYEDLPPNSVGRVVIDDFCKS